MAAQKNTANPDREVDAAEAMRRHAQDAAGLMAALGNESRLLILCALTNGERSVRELNDLVPLSQSALSQHLARLRRQDLVLTRREAQTIYYSLRPGPVDKIIHLLHGIYCAAPKSSETEKRK